MAIDSAVSFGRSNSSRNSVAHPPFTPYFFVPLAGRGVNVGPVQDTYYKRVVSARYSKAYYCTIYPQYYGVRSSYMVPVLIYLFDTVLYRVFIDLSLMTYPTVLEYYFWHYCYFFALRVCLPDMSVEVSAGRAGQAMPGPFCASSLGLARILCHFSSTAAPS